MGVYYDSASIIPAPFLSLNKATQATSDGTKVGSIVEITINGTLVAYKGSPQGGTLSGASWGGPYNRFWINSGYPPDESVNANTRLYSMEAKQEALRALFANDGKWLEWQAPDGSPALKCQPRFKDITFDQSPDPTWYQLCSYTIRLEADKLYLTGEPADDTPFNDELVSSAGETWEIADGEVAKTFRLSHTMSAVGKRQFDPTGNQVGMPWQVAQNFVQNRLSKGYTGTTSFSPVPPTQIVASSFLSQGVLNFSTLQAYNFVRTDSLDELAGSYSVNETWILSQAASGSDNFQVSIRKFSTEPDTTTTVGIQGTIRGFYTALNDYDQRFDGAKYVWAQLRGTPLFNRVQAYATGTFLNSQPLAGNVDYDYNAGTIAYNYEFSDRLHNLDTFEEYAISRTQSQSDYKTTLSIDGKITGRRYESDTDSNAKFARAYEVWTALSTFPNVYNRVVGSQFYPEVNNLKQYPVQSKVDMDQRNGVISYSFEFNNRENDDSVRNEDVHEDYNLASSFSRDSGKTTYTVAGTVEGLSIITGSGARAAKYAAATSYFGTLQLSGLLNRVLTVAGSLSNTTPIEYEIQKNPTMGTLTYSYKYTSEPAPFGSGALSEIITFSESNRDATVNVFAAIPILGRRQGPQLQDMSTTKEKMRSIDIEAVFATPNTGSILGDFNAQPNYDAVVSGVAPPAGTVFRDDDTHSWVPRDGRYSRNVRWIYQ